MKVVAAILTLASVSAATLQSSVIDNTQFAYDDAVFEHPDFNFNLAEMRLVQMKGQEPVWMSELEKIKAKAQGINFFDITETPDLGSLAHLRSAVKPTYPKPNASDLVKPVIKTLSTKGPRENLEKFTNFTTRNARSKTGKQSQEWLLAKIVEITSESAPPALQKIITVSEFPHPWGQNSLVARINGSSTTDDNVVILGAHQDSTNMWPFLPAPGADDDGSGTVTILEAYRALISADFRPVRPVEFHWYSAEEGGLLGSQALVKDYESRGVNVLAMVQFDVTAWVKKGTREEVGIITDFVDSGLTDFNKQLVDAYLDIPYVATQCGYACSDHGSWTKAGYSSSCTAEGAFENSNKHIHSKDDRIDISDEFSFDHMLEFSKFAVAYAIELGGWSQAD